MFIYDFVTAYFLITSPLSFNIQSIEYDKPDILIHSLAKFSRDNNIFEEEELKYYFVKEDQLIADIVEARKRFHDLQNAPEIEYIYSYSEWQVEQNLRMSEFLLDYKKYFYTGHPAFQQEIAEQIQEIKNYMFAFQCLKNSFNPSYGKYHRRMSLKNYKLYVGDEEFYSYRIPQLINLFQER